MGVLRALALFALIAYVQARVTNTVQPLSAQITPQADKEARQRAASHSAFANAGKRAGTEIWRIQNFNPVPVSQSDYGKFYKGDSYIVLVTRADNKNRLSWDIYYWIGSESSQDEAGAAAIYTVGLDDKLLGAAVQHRETFGSESQAFKRLFPSGLQYLEGGVETGFKHVTTNAGAEKRLFIVKGKRNVRVKQVEPQFSSLNKGDCFILDVNNDIYVLVGSKAKIVERMKAISFANQVRDQDHSGRGRVQIIDAYSNDADFQQFFTALGSGTKDRVAEESSGGDDQAFERTEEQAASLYEISDSTGQLKTTSLSKPFRQNMLKSQDVYVLDTGSGSVFTWFGRQATDREKTEAQNKAQQLLNGRTHPSWAQVVRIPQNAESAIFKQYFFTWQDVNMSHPRII